MENELYVLSASPVEIAQDSLDNTCKYATFLISVLDEYDRVGRMIPRESGEKYHSTLRGFPIVAKLIKDRVRRPIDFGGHEMRQWRKRTGEVETTFDTYPIGSVVDTWIEEREVDGYEGVKACIMAKAKLWTCRSPEYFAVLDRLWAEGKISSSWELIVTQKEEDSFGKKILRAFSFIGNALLGTTSVPAVKGAGILEYAEADEICQSSEELTEALLRDIQNEQEEVSMDTEKETTTPVEDADKNLGTPEVPETPENTETPEAQGTEPTPEEPATDNTEATADAPATDGTEGGTDTSAATAESETADLEPPIITDPVAEAPCGEPVAPPAPPVTNELEITLLALQQENEALKATIAELTAQLDALVPMKEEYERIQQEKAEAQRQEQIAALRKLALDSKLITEAEIADEGGNESIKTLISNLDENGLRHVIVDRLVAKVTAEAEVRKTPVAGEVSTASAEKKHTVKTDIMDTESASADILATNRVAQGAQLIKAILAQ